MLYILPCLLGLIIKGYFLVKTRYYRGKESVFFGLITVMAVHNFCELLGYLQFFHGTVPEIILRIYYVLTLLALTYIVLYAIEVSRILFLKKLVIPAYIFTVALGLLLVFTNTIVAGSIPTDYTVLALRGEQYWVFKTTAMVSFFVITTSLVFGYLKPHNSVHANQCLYCLFALSPIILVSVTFLVLMSFGLHYSIAVIMPICTSIFVLIVVRSELYKEADIRRLLPYSLERDTSEKINKVVDKFLIDEIKYRETLAQMGNILIEHALNKEDKNITHTANRLEVNRTTLHTWLKKIEEDKLK